MSVTFRTPGRPGLFETQGNYTHGQLSTLEDTLFNLYQNMCNDIPFFSPTFNKWPENTEVWKQLMGFPNYFYSILPAFLLVESYVKNMFLIETDSTVI